MRAIFEKTLVLAAAGAAAGGVALAVSTYRAVEVRAPQPEPLALATTEEAVQSPGFRALPAEAVSLIADNEPFREDRERAPLPYLMPGDRAPRREEPEPPPPPEPPSFTVLGTVLTANGGMAVIQTTDGLPPVFVNVNESVGGYRLVSVGSEGATLSRDDAMFNLAVAEPAAVREQPSRARNNNNNNRRNNENAQREEQARRALEQQTERLRELMEQARQGGGTQGVFFGVPGNQPGAAPGARVFITPDGQGGNIIIQEQQTVDPANGVVRQRVIGAVPRAPRQAQ